MDKIDFTIAKLNWEVGLYIKGHREVTEVIQDIKITVEELVWYVVSKDKEAYINNLKQCIK